MKEMDFLLERIHFAAENLNERSEMVISVENGSACVELKMGGRTWTVDDLDYADNEDSLDEQFDALLDWDLMNQPK